MDTSAWERVNCALFSADCERETNRKQSAHTADSYITPHPPVSPRPTGEDVMASFLKWHAIGSHGGSWPVCCSHSQDRSCLKYFAIPLARQRLRHARHKYCIGGEFKIILCSKQFAAQNVRFYVIQIRTTCVYVRVKGRSALLQFAVISQEAAAQQRRKSAQKLLGQCFLHFQKISRKLPPCPHSGHNAQRSGVRQTCVWPPNCCLARR